MSKNRHGRSALNARSMTQIPPAPDFQRTQFRSLEGAKETPRKKLAASWAGFGKVQWAGENAKTTKNLSQNTNFMKSQKSPQGDSGVVKCFPGWPGDARGSLGMTLANFRKIGFSTKFRPLRICAAPSLPIPDEPVAPTLRELLVLTPACASARP